MYHCLKYRFLKGNATVFCSLLLMENYNVVTDRILNWQWNMVNSSFLSSVLHSYLKNWYVDFAYLKKLLHVLWSRIKKIKLIQEQWTFGKESWMRLGFSSICRKFFIPWRGFRKEYVVFGILEAGENLHGGKDWGTNRRNDNGKAHCTKFQWLDV